jgi:hypothetical protein
VAPPILDHDVPRIELKYQCVWMCGCVAGMGVNGLGERRRRAEGYGLKEKVYECECVCEWMCVGVPKRSRRRHPTMKPSVRFRISYPLNFVMRGTVLPRLLFSRWDCLEEDGGSVVCRMQHIC